MFVASRQLANMLGIDMYSLFISAKRNNIESIKTRSDTLYKLSDIEKILDV